MVEGQLILNLEPPYVAFHSTAGGEILRSCEAIDIQAALIHLGANGHQLCWPLEECVVILSGDFSCAQLELLGLLLHKKNTILRVR
jgi:hypothetical protein